VNSQQLGILTDVQHGRAVGGEELGHGLVELVAAVGLDAGRSAEPGVGGSVRVVQRGVPDRDAGRELLLADLAEGVVVEQDVLDTDAVLTAVVSSAAYWPKPPSPVTATTGRPGAAAQAPRVAG
jgi:hypothetical protein